MTASQYVYFVGAEEPAAIAAVNMFAGLVGSLTHAKNEVLQATEGKRCVQIPTKRELFSFPKTFKATLLTYISC